MAANAIHLAEIRTHMTKYHPAVVLLPRHDTNPAVTMTSEWIRRFRSHSVHERFDPGFAVDEFGGCHNEVGRSWGKKEGNDLMHYIGRIPGASSRIILRSMKRTMVTKVIRRLNPFLDFKIFLETG